MFFRFTHAITDINFIDTFIDIFLFLSNTLSQGCAIICLYIHLLIGIWVCICLSKLPQVQQLKTTHIYYNFHHSEVWAWHIQNLTLCHCLKLKVFFQAQIVFGRIQILVVVGLCILAANQLSTGGCPSQFSATWPPPQAVSGFFSTSRKVPLQFEKIQPYLM